MIIHIYSSAVQHQRNAFYKKQNTNIKYMHHTQLVFFLIIKKIADQTKMKLLT